MPRGCHTCLPGESPGEPQALGPLTHLSQLLRFLQPETDLWASEAGKQGHNLGPRSCCQPGKVGLGMGHRCAHQDGVRPGRGQSVRPSRGLLPSVQALSHGSSADPKHSIPRPQAMLLPPHVHILLSQPWLSVELLFIPQNPACPWTLPRPL